MKSRIILFLVFSSFVIGKALAQCDTFKRVDINAQEVIKNINVNDYKFDVLEADPIPDPSEMREIYFIHGLGGTAAAWEKAAEACDTKYPAPFYQPISNFPARKCYTARPEYAKTSTGSLNSAAKDIRNQMDGIALVDSTIRGMHPNRSIIIAHSQGGLVTRQLMHLDFVSEPRNIPHGMNYGGVVTIASPLQGADILKNRDAGIPQFAKNACNTLILGFECEGLYYSSNLINSVPNLKSLKIVNINVPEIKSKLKEWVGNTLGAVAEKGCDLIANTALPMFFNDMYAGITNDYNTGIQQGNNTINMLNSDASNKQYQDFPKIAFYAVEPQDNILWRTLNWMINDPNKEDHFQANNDWKLFDNEIKDMISYYQVKSLLYYQVAAIHLQFASIATLHSAKMKQIEEHINATHTATAYAIGSDWFNKANQSWQELIGARTYNHSTGKWEVDTENDGVVLRKSAEILPEATYPSIRMEGSSHMQIRNDANLKTHLNNLFNGDYGEFFIVNKQ